MDNEHKDQNQKPVSGVSVGLTSRLFVVRASVLALIFVLLLGFLVYRIAYIQVVNGEEYRTGAIEQYTHELTIEAKRGEITDRNGTVIATTVTVQNCFISPADISDTAQRDLIVSGLSSILGVDKEIIETKCGKISSKYQIIKKDLTEDEETRVRSFIADNGLTSVVCLEESSKRYYPYGSFACHVLGFTGADNTGLQGLEYTYNEYLSGTDGRVVKATDADGNEIPYDYESYIDAINGYTIVSTLDWTIQSIVEKYVGQAYDETLPTGTVTAIIMDVNTGEVLALANAPAFDLNNYGTLCSSYQALYDAYEGTDEGKAAYRTELLYDMWSNFAVSSTYEPGSTFKMVTGAIALENGCITKADTFVCTGKYVIAGVPIKCHVYGKTPHGTQSFAQAIKNSCNPAFIQISQKIGADLFLEFFDLFGYTEKIGSDFLGEASSIYSSSLGVVDLATAAFGQGFKVTPIQHLRAVCAVANGGYLVTPHLVSKIADSDGNVIKTIDYGTARQVVSQSTCDIILEALVNSTKNACVNGYNVVSKTGTSQKLDTADENDYVLSCVTFAPAEDPQIAILVLVDDPQNTESALYGSSIAAPIVSNVLTEVLPYLGILPTGSGADTVTIKDYRGTDVDTASYVIEQLGLKVCVKGTGSTVVDQLPRSGVELDIETGIVVLYTDTGSTSEMVVMPDLSRMSPSKVTDALASRKLNLSVSGIYNDSYTNCYVYSQSVAAGELVAPGTVIYVEFRYDEDIE